MKKEKCYIAGKIGDMPKEEYEANFEKAKEEVIALGFIPVSPTELSHNHDKTWSAHMREDLIEMLKCSHVYACRNWRQSTGATIEINLALSIGLHIIHQPARAVTNG